MINRNRCWIALYIVASVGLLAILLNVYSWRPHKIFRCVQEPLKYFEVTEDCSKAIITTKTRVLCVNIEKDEVIWEQFVNTYGAARYIPNTQYVTANVFLEEGWRGVLWDLSSGKLIAKINQPVPNGTFSPNGRYLANDVPNGGYKIPVWDFSQVSSGGIARLYGLSAKDRIISEVCFSPDSQTLAVSAWDQGKATVELWSMSNGKLRASLSTHGRLAWNRDSQILTVATDSAVQLWDIARKSKIRSIPLPSNSTRYSVKYLRDRKFLLIQDGDSLNILDLATGQCIRKPAPYNNPIMAISRDSHYIYSMSSMSNDAISLRLQ